MTQKELDDIKRICEAEYSKAKTKLDEGELSIFDAQYHLGRKHAAKDILYKINFLEATE